MHYSYALSTKVKSLSLEKTPSFTGRLTGIKGQYLLFEDGTVFNIRSSEICSQNFCLAEKQ
jgi:hypothetical protein